MKRQKGTNASIFELNGIPQLSSTSAGFGKDVVAMTRLDDPGWLLWQ
ncbi:MAG: hypothetical protein ACLTDV_04645 [Eubacterium sp.]